MKRFIFCALICGATVSAEAQMKFGVQGGGTLSSIRTKTNGVDAHSEGKAGFLAGGLMDVDFGSNISFRPELNFIRKGGQVETLFTSGGVTTEAETEISLSYLQLAPNFVYNLKQGKGKFFVGLGPEFSVGLGGKTESFVKNTVNLGAGGVISSTNTTESDIKFDKDNVPGSLKRFDFGGTALAGYQMAKGLVVSAGYTHGFANITPNGNNDNSSKNRSGFLKLGYML